MSTSFAGSPELDDILAGASVVATGVLREIVSREEDDEGRVFATYRVGLTDVIEGRPNAKEVLVRVVDGGDEPSDRECLLVLAPDYGHGSGEQYVPYFGPPSPIEGGRCVVGEHSVAVDDVRERIATVAAARAHRAAALEREEKGQDLKAAYPDVAELGAGRGDTVVDAQLAEPLPGPDADEQRQNGGKGDAAAD